MSILERALRMGEAKQFKTYSKRVERINAWEAELELLEDEELREQFAELRTRVQEEGLSLEEALPESFALTREVGRRTMGMRHFDVQLIGGMVLNDGQIAEMRTGEGKTLTGTLAVVLNALAGKGVHVVTVNDYLARRDADWMRPIYEGLGLAVGILQNNQPYEEKRAAYAADITYGTNSEFGFDYLRDNMATSLEEKVQHGGRISEDGKPIGMYNFAIVDEVDNILIDEARTPLIISGAPEQAADLYERFAKLAPNLIPGKKPEGMDPRAKKDFTADYDYEFDEKHKTISVTEQGVTKAERFLGIDHLYKADNAVVDGEVKIIDEFTGRILDGRRWSEGLHQAVEAKEGVRVREENQTLATVTLQNYFRMYDKLAGMSGTALTEATEFMKIYKVGVVEIPTNRPMVRKDQNDQIYKTREGKWRAVARAIEERVDKGQPVLVGTISVETSELLSERLRKMGVPHTVLNAKPEHAEREGSIIAEAGAPGAVTIATNMAGRGVDIKLGGNAEHLTQIELVKLGLRPGDPDYEERFAQILPKIEERVEANRDIVTGAGGLFIVGTERHESRRIDNQLRGRAGRQGDPGESRFFLSAEDDLVRLFAGDRIYKILDRLGPKGDDGEEEPIEAKMLTKQIEGAQRKVEEQNYLIRKRVLVDEYTPGDFVDDWDLDELWVQLEQIYHVDFGANEIDRSQTDRDSLRKLIVDDAMSLYDEREEELGDELMRALERYLVLQIIDQRWREHLYDMDYLREGIHLRGFAQIEPLVAYKNEAFTLFEDLMNSIWADFARMIYNVQVEVQGPNGDGEGQPAQQPVPEFAPPPQMTSGMGALAYSGGTLEDQPTAYGEPGEPPAEEMPVVQQRRVDEHETIGRNDPCWCGSGKKFKKCHGA